MDGGESEGELLDHGLWNFLLYTSSGVERVKKARGGEWRRTCLDEGKDH